MNPKTFLLAVLTVLFTCSIVAAQAPPDQEEITLSTYYPAPYGEYDELCAEKLLIWSPISTELAYMSLGDCHIGYSLIVGKGGTGFSYDELNSAATPLRDGDVIIKGYLGIGTTSPASLLHVNGSGASIRVSGTGASGGSGESSLLLTTTNTGGPTTWSVRAGSTNTIQNLRIGTTSSYDMINIDTSGNVGIGTTGPDSQLHVENTAATFQVGHFKTNAGEFRLKFTDNQGSAYLNKTGQKVSLGTVSGLSTSNLVIDGSTGNVGIGTTSPQAKLHVGGTAGTDGIMFPDGTLQTTAEPPKARVYLNYFQQNLPQNTWTVVELNEISYDPNGMVNVGTHRITISEAGYYAIDAGAFFINTVDERLYYLAVRKNGNRFVTIGGAHTSMSAYNLPVSVADTVYLAAGDYLELIAEPIEAGSTTDLGGYTGEGQRTFLAIHKIP